SSMLHIPIVICRLSVPFMYLMQIALLYYTRHLLSVKAFLAFSDSLTIEKACKSKFAGFFLLLCRKKTGRLAFPACQASLSFTGSRS
ncbi:MAG: hypothetical protein IKP72_06925, partial [Clostridia bacterium]|nr:hypothetical protein [Clostridia bacterium]